VCPGPVSDRVANPRAYGVLDDVAARRAEVVLAFDRPGGEAACEERPETPVTLVEGLCVAAERPLQPARQLGLRGVKDEVVVGRHQAERVNSPAVALDAEEDLREKRAAISVVAEHRAPVHTP